jgi:hypothetical protein
MKIKLKKKYAIGVHVMFFEIEIFKEYIRINEKKILY